MAKILVTGGAGFIGSAVIRHVLGDTHHSIVNVDKLTYAGNLQSLRDVSGSPRYAFEQADVCNGVAIAAILAKHQPDAVMHLAAETHVDRSIEKPSAFIDTNIVGTHVLLSSVSAYWEQLDASAKATFRFHNVSTDEVFGDLGDDREPANEDTPYAPSSPYAASKAAADHLVRAWHRTYGLPAVITNCSNNYGPFQYPEKLIPHVLLTALAGRILPVYGDGKQVRDWLFVEDHARGLVRVLFSAMPGATYNLGGRNEITNLDVVGRICAYLDKVAGDRRDPRVASYVDLISFVRDRPGHDRRYSMDTRRIERQLQWAPEVAFDDGLAKTISWYLENEWWWRPIVDRDSPLTRRGTQRLR